MNPLPNTRVVFFQVNSGFSKVEKISLSAQIHFQKKEPLLIVVEDESAARFVDEVLWKFPKTSFLPHVSTEKETKDYIAITTVKKNLNSANYIFNLTPTALLLETDVKIIYEFEDLSSPIKKSLSSNRLDVYKNAGFSIEAR